MPIWVTRLGRHVYVSIQWSPVRALIPGRVPSSAAVARAAHHIMPLHSHSQVEHENMRYERGVRDDDALSLLFSLLGRSLSSSSERFVVRARNPTLRTMGSHLPRAGTFHLYFSTTVLSPQYCFQNAERVMRLFGSTGSTPWYRVVIQLVTKFC